MRKLLMFVFGLILMALLVTAVTINGVDYITLQSPFTYTWDYVLDSTSITSQAYFLDCTTVTTTGNMVNGSKVGYEAGSGICNTTFPETHMCTMEEVVQTQNIGQYFNFTDTCRVSEGAPGFTADAGDCGGWKNNDSAALGSIWVGDNTTGGKGSQINCEALRAIACCK